MPLTEATKAELRPWLRQLRDMGYMSEDDYFFQAGSGGNKAISRSKAWQIIHDAAQACGLTGRIGTHSLRKTFADRIYSWLLTHRTTEDEPIDALRTLAKALGHQSIDSTDKYLSFREETIRDAVEEVFGGQEDGRSEVLHR